MTNTTETLYLTSWDYNKALIMDELEKIIKSKGGKLVSTWQTTRKPAKTIINRSISEHLRELQEVVDRSHKQEVINEYLRKIEKIKQYRSNKTVYSNYASCFGCYMSFELNNIYYYLQLDDNPFFDFLISKEVIDDNHIYNNVCDDLPKEWLEDILLSYKCTNADIKKAARNIFEILEKMPARSNPRQGQKKQLHVIG